jgi:hypothetical protein
VVCLSYFIIHAANVRNLFQTAKYLEEKYTYYVSFLLKVKSLELRAVELRQFKGQGFMVHGSRVHGSRVHGSRFKVRGSRFKVKGKLRAEG